MSAQTDVEQLADVMNLIDHLEIVLTTDRLCEAGEQALTTSLIRTGHIRVASNTLRTRIGKALDLLDQRRKAAVS